MIKRILFILLQCTWGAGQTLIGLGFFLAHLRCSHRMYRGCIDTQWNRRGGLSLGLFIFTPPDDRRNSEQVRVHEYGHAIQSLVLGPLMLFVGIISVAWANLPCFVKLRRTKKVPYTVCFVEMWASRWGELVTGEPAIR